MRANSTIDILSQWKTYLILQFCDVEITFGTKQSECLLSFRVTHSTFSLKTWASLILQINIKAIKSLSVSKVGKVSQKYKISIIIKCFTVLEGGIHCQVLKYLHSYKNVTFLTTSQLGPFSYLVLKFESSKFDIPKLANSIVGRVAYQINYAKSR